MPLFLSSIRAARKVHVAVLMVFAIIAGISRYADAQVRLQSQRENSSDYKPDFELPPTDTWEGKTEHVKYIPPRGSAGNWSGGSFINYGFYAEGHLAFEPPVVRDRPPIELTRFNSLQRVRTKSTVSETRNDTGTASHNLNAPNGGEATSYAHVRGGQGVFETLLGRQGPLLAFAEGYVSQDASADDYTMSSNGKVWNTADILEVLSGNDSSAEGSSRTEAVAEYHLTQAHEFLLDYTLASEDEDAEYYFRLTDLKSDQIVIDTHATAREKLRYQFCGTLLPGTYELTLHVESDSSIKTNGSPNFGGYGEFDFYFRAFDPHGEIVPILHPSEERKPGVRYSDGVYIDPNGSGEPLGMSSFSVPEPGGPFAILLSLFAVAILRRRLRCGVTQEHSPTLKQRTEK